MTPEEILYSSLTDPERIDLLAKEGLDPAVIPTESMRPVVDWALTYYFQSGCKQAPSREALLLEWSDVIEESGMELVDPEDEIDTLQWALEHMKSTYLHIQWQEWFRKAAMDMASSSTADRLDVFSRHLIELGELSSRIRSRTSEGWDTDAFDDALRRYHERVMRGGQPQGMMLGLGMLDEHTHGIHDGELAVVAAPPKAGKSYLLDHAVLAERQRGRRVILFTLENSVDMTIDRMVCMIAHVDSRKWQRGKCDESEVRRVEEARDYLNGMPGEMIVLKPPEGQRTVEAMVREAQVRGADSLIIDQLTFVEAPYVKGRPRNETVAHTIRSLKNAISSGVYNIPCLLAHQVNREGQKAAEKTGYLEMYMLAESSEVERTADWVFGLYRGSEDREAGLAKLQVLASRREELNAWRLAYQPGSGVMETIGEITVGGE